LDSPFSLALERDIYPDTGGIGAALWAGMALLAGFAFQSQITGALAFFEQHGFRLAAVVLTLIAIWLVWKFWQKHRFERMATMHHVSADELLLALAGPRPPHILDLRSQVLVSETGSIPHAHIIEYDAISSSLENVPKDYPIVTICACPQDAGAVQVARSLQKQGYRYAHPLRGGFEAWKTATEKI